MLKQFCATFLSVLEVKGRLYKYRTWFTIWKNRKKGRISSINRNTQWEELERATSEAIARELCRKWDNDKVIVGEIKDKKIYRQSYNNSNLWGQKITNKERFERDRGLKIGTVVTLKEMNEKNRIKEFIDQCTMRNWIVNRINIENRLDVYAMAEEIIKIWIRGNYENKY